MSVLTPVFSRPTTSFIENIRFSPAAGLSRSKLGAMREKATSPPACASETAKPAVPASAMMPRPSVSHPCMARASTVEIAACGSREDSAAKISPNSARKVSMTRGACEPSAASTTRKTSAELTSVLNTISPFLRASRRRLSVGA